MLRNIILGFAGLVLSGILLMVAGWLAFNFSEQGALIRAHGAGILGSEEFAEAFLGNAESFQLTTKFIVMPLIGVITGSFVGLFAKQRPWLPALIAISPVLLFFLLRPDLKDFVLCAIYAALAVATATVLRRLIQKRRLRTSNLNHA